MKKFSKSYQHFVLITMGMIIGAAFTILFSYSYNDVYLHGYTVGYTRAEVKCEIDKNLKGLDTLEFKKWEFDGKWHPVFKSINNKPL